MQWTLVALIFGLIACGGGVVQRVDAYPPPPVGKGWLTVECEPTDVDVHVDDVFRGQLDGYPRGVLAVANGRRRVLLQRSGYYAHYAVVDIGEVPAVLRTRLVPLVP